MYKYHITTILELKSLKKKGITHRIDTNVLLSDPIATEEEANYVVDTIVADNIKRKTIRKDDVISYYGIVLKPTEV